MAGSIESSDVDRLLAVATELLRAVQSEPVRLGGESGRFVECLLEAARVARKREEAGRRQAAAGHPGCHADETFAGKDVAAASEWSDVAECLVAAALSIYRAHQEPREGSDDALTDVEPALTLVLSQSGDVIEPEVIHKIADQAMATSRSSIAAERRPEQAARVAESPDTRVAERSSEREDASRARVADVVYGPKRVDAPEQPDQFGQVSLDLDRWLASGMVVVPLFYLALSLMFGSDREVEWATAIGALLVAAGSSIQAVQELRRYSRDWLAYAAPGGLWRTLISRAAVDFTSATNPRLAIRRQRYNDLIAEGRRRLASHSVEEQVRLRQQASEAMLGPVSLIRPHCDGLIWPHFRHAGAWL